MIYRNTPERQAIADVLRGLLATRKLRKVCEDLTRSELDLGMVVQAKLQQETETSNIYARAYSTWHQNLHGLFIEWNGALEQWGRFDHPIYGCTWHGQESESRWRFIESLFKHYQTTPAQLIVEALNGLKPRVSILNGSTFSVITATNALIKHPDASRLWRDTYTNAVQSWLTGPGAGTIGLSMANGPGDWSEANTDRWSMVGHLIAYYTKPEEPAQ